MIADLRTDFDNPVKQLLRRVFLHSHAAKRCAKEGAEMCGVKERTFRCYMDRTNRTEIPARAYADLARYLFREYQDRRLIDHLIPDGAVIVMTHGATNGEIADDMTRIVSVLGDLVDAWTDGDMDAAAVAQSRLTECVGTLGDEIQRRQS